MNASVVRGEKINKYMLLAERYIFPAVLFVFPLLFINQGIDISDTTYSLGNYRFMENMDIMWVLATYLANISGAFLMRLPFGNTMLGMNLYTGLIVSLFVLFCYKKVQKWMPAWLVFIGEIIALSLCWSPTTALYHYMTYILFTAGSIYLYEAYTSGKNKYYIVAGICLGLNIMVRFPNVTEAALILAVWYGGWLGKDKFTEIIKKTGCCLTGYLAGAGSILLVIMIKYGFGAFGSMINSLFKMTGEASDYTLAGMLSLIGSAYLHGFKWIAYMIPCIFAGIVMFCIKKGRWEMGKKALYIAGVLILLRFYWGQGMFSLRYYNEGCIFQWMMLFLIMSVLLCILEIGGYLPSGDKGKVLAAIVLVIILITPLGSNNYTYANMNNLFFVAPYTLWASYRLWIKTRSRSICFPWQAFMAVILIMTLVQGIGFGLTYVFKDGIHGEKRTHQVNNSPVLAGMYTTEENADSLSELIGFLDEGNIITEPALIWGDAPGLSYVLDVPSAIFTTWPEAPSNTYAALEASLMGLDYEPVILMRGEEMKTKKRDLITDFIVSRHYECIYDNKGYQVYRSYGGKSER